MKKHLILILCAAMLLLPGCQSKPAASASASTPVGPASSTVQIVTTTYPLYLLTTALTEGVEGVYVSQLSTQGSSCLHDYTLTVTDMKLLETADVIVLSGAELEDFMSDALATSSAQVIDCAQSVDLLVSAGHREHHDHETEHDHPDEDEHTHDHGHFDPHYWMDPIAMSTVAGALGAQLGAVLPQQQSRLTQNAQTASQTLTQLDETLQQLVSGSGLSADAKNLITFHDGFEYLAARYGFTILKSIEEEEGSTASAHDINDIVALIQAHHIPAIFTEVNGFEETANAIARETGVSVYPLSLIMSGEGSSLDAYCTAMTQNITTMLSALQTGG